jgi:hypothetical protein
MPNADFAPWLKNNSAGDEALSELKRFAEAHRAEWPYDSNRMSDYVRVVLNAHDPKEEALLTSLERYFLAWRNTRNGWRLWSAESALLAAGLIVAIIVASALFYTNLIEKLASPGSARGLITFLFSFITIAVILIVIIALLWMDKDEDLENRFTKAKDIIAILVGILGTIVGFYFGSNASPSVGSSAGQTALSPPNVATAPRAGIPFTAGANGPAGANGTEQPAASRVTPELGATPR